VDLWSAKGPMPQNLLDVDERRKDIVYSSRTRLVTDVAGQMQRLRHALRKALDKLPPDLQADAEIAALRELSCSKVYNTVQLIYRDKQYETHSKDYEFSILNMREHWQAGLDDIRHTLQHPEWLARPTGSTGVVTHDVHQVEG
jgi:NTE family protein